MDPFNNRSCYSDEGVEEFSIYKHYKGSRYSVQVCQLVLCNFPLPGHFFLLLKGTIMQCHPFCTISRTYKTYFDHFIVLDFIVLDKLQESVPNEDRDSEVGNEL